MAWMPGASPTPLPSFLLWGVAWGAMAAAWAVVRGDGTAGGGVLSGRRGRAVVWAVGLAARLVLLPAEPHFSDDVYRFLWDGWVSLHGVNPYLHPPDAAELDPLRTAWHTLVNHPSVRTIYPPAAQAVFALLASVAPSVLLFKAAWVAADLGVARVLDRLDRRRPGPRVALLLWLWSPLVLVEVAWSGHLEPLAILPMAAALLWLDGRGSASPPARDPGGRTRPSVAGALLGLGAAAKFAPAAALPALWRRHGVRAAAALLAVPLLLLLPYLDAGTALVAGLGEYAARWQFNAGAFLVLEAVAGGDAARIAGAAAPAALAAVAAWRAWSVERALFWCVGAALILSPTLHPWYLLWALPFAAIRRSRAWILWTGLIFLAYAGHDVYRATGRWPQPPLLRAAVHLPFLVALAAEALAATSPGARPGTRGRGR